MGNTFQNSENELVIAIRSPLFAWMGGLSLFFLLCLAYLLIAHVHPGHGRLIGLAGASITCALVFLALHERTDFRFDLPSRTLTWSRLRGLSWQRGSMPFDSIKRVILQFNNEDGDQYHPGYRVVLLTSAGELPLKIAYEHDGVNEVILEKIRTFLGLIEDVPLEDSIRSLVEDGRDVDAIRLLREKNDMSVGDARNLIANIRAGKDWDSPDDSR